MMRYLRENKKYKMVMRWMGKLFLTVILVSTTTGCQPGKAAGGSVQEMELLNEESKTEPATESKAESEKEASANGQTDPDGCRIQFPVRLVSSFSNASTQTRY